MRKVTLLGQEITVAFNMATEIAYEELSGEGFSVDALKKTLNTVCLYAAVVVTNNPGCGITADDILYRLSGTEIATLRDAVIEAMNDWMTMPAVMEKDAGKVSEGGEKN